MVSKNALAIYKRQAKRWMLANARLAENLERGKINNRLPDLDLFMFKRLNWCSRESKWGGDTVCCGETMVLPKEFAECSEQLPVPVPPLAIINAPSGVLYIMRLPGQLQ